MRMMWFLPLTYVAGIDGFRWFVPYLLGVALLAFVLGRARRASARVGQGLAASFTSLSSDLELEPAAA